MENLFWTALLLQLVASVPVTVWNSKDNTEVDVRVYYESLCPSSREFISQLSTQAPNLEPLTSLSMFPYGNAHPTTENSTCISCDTCNVWECNVTCQHGSKECKLNLAQACLLEYLPAFRALPAIHCIERLIFPAEWCISHHAPDGVNLAILVKKCMTSPLGKAIQNRMATETLQLLNPPKQFVPWVTVDGLPLVDDYKNLIPAVCQRYRDRGGNSVPEICAKAAQIEKGWGTEPNISIEVKRFQNESIIFTRCRILKVLGEVCVEVFISSPSSTAQSLGLILEFKRAGLRFEFPLISSSVCITDSQLLELMLLIPELKPFEDTIRKLIHARGMIPAEVFSECLVMSNITGSGRNMSGCIALDSRVMCFKSKCLYKAADSFGCFHA